MAYSHPQLRSRAPQAVRLAAAGRGGLRVRLRSLRREGGAPATPPARRHGGRGLRSSQVARAGKTAPQSPCQGVRRVRPAPRGARRRSSSRGWTLVILLARPKAQKPGAACWAALPLLPKSPPPPKGVRPASDALRPSLRPPPRAPTGCSSRPAWPRAGGGPRARAPQTYSGRAACQRPVAPRCLRPRRAL